VHGYFARDIQKSRTLRRHLFAGEVEPLRVGIFVEDMDEIHGVATLYKNLKQLAGKSQFHHLRFIQCANTGQGDTVRLRPIATLPIPLVEERLLGVPSLLDVLDHVAAERYDLLHVVAPGPLGLAALIAGSTLGIPTVGAYHTEFGQYAQVLSGDAVVADIVEVAVREFYERCAVVAVPSQSTAFALRNRGYRIDRIEILKNGVDTDLYRPDRRSEQRRSELGGGRMLLLYAGRVSREKGLERLADGYLALRERRDDVQLVIAGDGPFREDLQLLLGDKATFTGFLRGADLADTYAACDVFVFPSTTDTLGRAVAEAQASGMPAVVYGTGGPQECIRPDVSGFVADAGDESGFWDRVEQLLDDPARRIDMGEAARRFALTLSWDSVLDGLIDLYREIVGGPVTVAGTGVEFDAARLVAMV
jgi:glycosyltransferase involved in cell wall biosynthesis